MEPKSLRCFAGLCDSSMPVRVGENLVAFLQMGQVLEHSPTKKQFNRVAQNVLKFGTEVDLKKLEEAWFQSRVVSKKQHESIVRLLSIFAQYLAALSNQLMVQEETAESPLIARAREFIEQNHSEETSLEEVAGTVNMSAFYF